MHLSAHPVMVKEARSLLNWKELGYPDDPMKKGGRVKNKLVKE